MVHVALGRSENGRQREVVVLVLWLVCASNVLGQAVELAHIAGPKQVLAYVGKQPVTMAEVNLQLGRSGELAEVPLPVSVQGATLELIAQQRQALQTLRKMKLAAEPEEVSAWFRSQASNRLLLERDDQAAADSNGSQPQAVDPREVASTLAAGYAVDEQVLWDWIAFRLSWQRYLSKHLTEENVARHYRNQQARFDGTQFEMHLLSVVAAVGQSDARDRLAEVLASVASRLAEKDLSEVVTSIESELQVTVVSDKQIVRGVGSLEPSIVDTLLGLKPGEWSEPLHTATGVHVVMLVKSTPGSRTLEEVRDEVRAHMLLFLLRHLANQSREELPVRSVLQNGVAAGDAADHQ